MPALKARQAEAEQRAADGETAMAGAALAQPGELKQWQETAAQVRRGEKIRDKELGVSTTGKLSRRDGEARFLSERGGYALGYTAEIGRLG